MGTNNETNRHRTARRLKDLTGIGYQKAFALLADIDRYPVLDTAEQAHEFVARRTTAKQPATPAVTGSGEGRATCTGNGRCTVCRSWVDDLGADGICWPCSALESGDLIACVNCGHWVSQTDAGKPCEQCGLTPATVVWFRVVIDDEIGHTDDTFTYTDLPAEVKNQLPADPGAQITVTGPNGEKTVVHVP
jgi:hypothetical protein